MGLAIKVIEVPSNYSHSKKSYFNFKIFLQHFRETIFCTAARVDGISLIPDKNLYFET